MPPPVMLWGHGQKPRDKAIETLHELIDVGLAVYVMISSSRAD